MVNWADYVQLFSRSFYGHYEPDRERRIIWPARIPRTYSSIISEGTVPSDFIMNLLFASYPTIIKNYEAKYNEEKKTTEYVITVRGTKGKNNSHFDSEFKEECFKRLINRVPRDVKVSFYDVYGNDMSFLIGDRE